MNKDFFHNRLFKLLEINNRDELRRVAKQLELSVAQLEYYNNNLIYPSGDTLNKILQYKNMSNIECKIRLGVLDNSVVDIICDNPNMILDKIDLQPKNLGRKLIPDFNTNYGELYESNCLNLLNGIESEKFDLIFADPPFNLSKEYESGINDNLSEEEYLIWTEKWLIECIRVLKPGGALFIYNIPKWLTYISGILNKYLSFRHWITINFRGLTPPIANRLNVNHYGILYYIKGERPNRFNTQRIPMKTCRHCGGEIHDYGGKKKDANKFGQTISDVWEDITPVRHKEHKNREENELPIKLLFRIISLATDKGDLIFDPFGGSGTTYIAAELLERNWIGSEIGSLDSIINRFNNIERDTKKLLDFMAETNTLFTQNQKKLRIKNGFWIAEDYELI